MTTKKKGGTALAVAGLLILVQLVGFGSCYLKDYIHKQEDNEMRGK